MKKVYLLILIPLLFSCSKKDHDEIKYKHVTYQFEPAHQNNPPPNGANIVFFSHRENKEIFMNIKDLYSYSDRVKIGDRLTLTMTTDGPIAAPFSIYVSIADYGPIMVSSRPSSVYPKYENDRLIDTYPMFVKIDKILKQSYFEIDD